MGKINKETMIQTIINKINTNIKLNKTEKQYIANVLMDPLQEFCAREAIFRLKKIMNIDDKLVLKLSLKATETIRDVIDYDENLYDSIDNELRKIIEEEE